MKGYRLKRGCDSFVADRSHSMHEEKPGQLFKYTGPKSAPMTTSWLEFLWSSHELNDPTRPTKERHHSRKVTGLPPVTHSPHGWWQVHTEHMLQTERDTKADVMMLATSSSMTSMANPQTHCHTVWSEVCKLAAHWTDWYLWSLTDSGFHCDDGPLIWAYCRCISATCLWIQFTLSNY